MQQESVQTADLHGSSALVYISPRCTFAELAMNGDSELVVVRTRSILAERVSYDPLFQDEGGGGGGRGVLVVGLGLAAPRQRCRECAMDHMSCPLHQDSREHDQTTHNTAVELTNTLKLLKYHRGD